MSVPETKNIISYDGNKIEIDKLPQNGESISVYARPGDDVDINFDLEGAEYKLVGGDIVLSLPNGSVITFVSMGIMSLDGADISFNLPSGQSFGTQTLINSINDIVQVPNDNTITNASVVPVSNLTDEEQENTEAKDSDEEVEKIRATINELIQNQRSVPTVMLEDDSGSRFTSNAEPNDYTANEASPVVESLVAEKTFTGNFSRPARTTVNEENMIPDPGYEVMEKNDFVDYHQDSQAGYGDGMGDTYEENEGAVDDAAKPEFYFKATAHQYKQNQTTTDEGVTLQQGGGGSIDGYKFDSVTNQFEDEAIDVSSSSEDMVIRSENSTYFTDDPSSIYLSRVLRFEPQMPEGFFVESFSLSGLPSGVVLMDKDGNEIAGSSISKEQMILKDELGNEIFYGDDGFIDAFKVAEFTIKYSDPDSMPETFDVAITANYSLESSYSDSTDLASNQSYTNSYTFALKDISTADDFSYKKEDFSGGQDEGFILAKDINDNIIKDGSGDSTIYGGVAKDVVYDGAGDDTIHTSANSDTIYGGAGTNFIDGDSYTDESGNTVTYTDADTRDKVSYAEVKSYSLTELKLLRNEGMLSDEEYSKLQGSYTELDENDNEIPNTLDVDMLSYYKGVYVDLEGFTDEETLWVDHDGDEVVDDNEKINALSKFAFTDGTFTYNDDGDAISTTLTGSGLSTLQLTGYDTFTNIEDVDGSNFNDTIYGNDSTNIISGLKGSDILDGRGGGDTLLGNEGYDTLYSGSGDDYIDGGEDTDAVNYQNSGSGVVVRLDKPNGDEYDDYSTGHGSDKLYNIEDVVGSEYTDSIFGSGGTNYLMGMGGDDSFFAGKGYDFIDGGSGNDWISYYKEDYPDRATNDSYMEDIQGITVGMGNDFVMLKETSTGRLIDLVKDIEQVRGTYGVDTIWGDNSDEVFWGFEGNDNLRGWNGNDTLLGGDDDDYILPGRGEDYSDGGEGIDFLDLHREDTLKNKTEQWLRLDESGTVQYSTNSGGNWSNGYQSNSGLETAINFEGMRGDDSSDHIIGNSKDNRLEGHNGDDDIYGQGGNDFIRGGNGDDSLYGEAGDDTIYGDRNDDYIEGGIGDDLIYGYARYGNESNNDTIDGGDGSDTLSYISERAKLIVDMSTVNGDDYSTVDFSNESSGGDGRYDDLFKNIENITGGRGNDTITGDDNANIINGWHGNDVITGGDGNDTLYGGAHVDSVYGGDGDDYINLDQYSDENERVHGQNNEHAYGGVGNDTIVSQGGRDYLYGDAVDAVDAANAGRDTTNDGDDTFIVHHTPYDLHGGEGTDTLTLGDTYLDLRSTDIKDMEILNLGSGGRAYFNFDQFFTDNAFQTVTGDENSELYIYGDGSDDNFNFTNIDISGFSGILYANGYGGNDTLTLGDNQTVRMTDNYFNTIEDFDTGSGSSLNVEALNDNGRPFYAHNKNFDDITDDGAINLTGGTGSDSFYVDEQYLDKISIDGGSGSDVVDFRTYSKTNETVDLSDSGLSNNISDIERVDIDDWGGMASRNNDVLLSAENLDSWASGDELELRVHGRQVDDNESNGTLTIKDSQSAQDESNNAIAVANNEISGSELNEGESYSVDTTDAGSDENFTLHVV